MILHCNFEELRALAAGAEMLATATAGEAHASVAAPSEAMALVEALVPRLSGDLSVTTLAEQRQIQEAVTVIVDSLLARMDERILEYHPAHEEAVSLYFDYAHSRSVLDRVERMGSEMDAIIELITGQAATPEAAAAITFGD